MFEVFYLGLKWKLVTKTEIVKWADDIILAEAEPDYFFIELAMSKNINEVIALIGNRMNKSTDPIAGRVLLSLTFNQLNNTTISLQRACDILDGIALLNTLTNWERGHFFQFYDEIQELFRPDDIENLRLEILTFLSVYKDKFNFDNYEEWGIISNQIATFFPN
ncbi:hypothetical protein [Mucilaginibacter rubeus]|uniref:Uncharacterized protein n=1 Tax=Mucilaginibacter rubeus TaxID=2027860 RepID=A0A5C1HZR7_9SPHI|nr:hypothetical protein [Mucilaginibacter rubeus]QEM11164.1 hypothetical protein DEO27_014415 [Mucilaginibacter rubeus]